LSSKRRKQLQFSRIHTSQRCRGILSNLKIKTGLTPNILSRFGICLSLKDPSIPNPEEFDENGTEFLPLVLFGEHEKLFLALMIDRLHRDGLDPEKYLNIMIRAHLNRGVYSLVSRVYGLSGINEMIKAEMKY
jgi:DNA sulfur modification protein DndE